MIQLKRLRNISILFIFLTSNIDADIMNDIVYPKYICHEMFREFSISPEIKSSKGWMRVKYKNTLHNYILPECRDKLTETKKNILMSCLITSSDNFKNLEHNIGDR